MVRAYRSRLALILCCVAIAVSGCAARVERTPVPATLVDSAAIPGLSHARFWGDEAPNDILAFVQTHMPAAKRMAVSRKFSGAAVIGIWRCPARRRRAFGAGCWRAGPCGDRPGSGSAG
jgi:hypothetical protein